MFENSVREVSVYEIQMAPFPKARPRVTINGTYMPPEYIARREELQGLFLQEGGQLNIEGEIQLTVAFRFRMPKSWSKKKREETDGLFCGKTPDLDNCIGAVMDALFANDSRVISINAHKQWSYEDSIYIMIGVEDG